MTTTVALREGALFLGDNGRIMCAKCAGSTALHTGHDLSGQPVSRVTIADVTEWASYDIGSMACECRTVTLSPLADATGWPVSR